MFGAVSASHSDPPVGRLEANNRFGKDVAGITDPSRQKVYFAFCDVMLHNKTSGKGG